MPQTLLTWFKLKEIDAGVRDGMSRADAQWVEQLKREVKELRPPTRSCVERVFRQAEAQPQVQIVREIIDEHCDTFGLQPICKIEAFSRPDGPKAVSADCSYCRRIQPNPGNLANAQNYKLERFCKELVRKAWVEYFCMEMLVFVTTLQLPAHKI